MRIRMATWLAAAGCALVAPMAVAQPTYSVSPAEAARQLFEFAERTYPTLFGPTAPTGTHGPFAYRHYPDSGLYLGVAMQSMGGYAKDGVYIQGGSFGQTPRSVGPLNAFVNPTAAIKVIDLAPYGLVADPTRDLYYAGFEEPGVGVSRKIVRIDSRTGALSYSEPLDIAVRSLAVAPDGNSIYIGGTTPAGIGEVQRRTLPDLQLLRRMPMSHDLLVPAGLVASPVDPDTIAVMSASRSGGGASIQIARNMSLQAKRWAPLSGPHVVFSADGSQLFAIETGSSTVQVYWIPITAEGAGVPEMFARHNAGAHLPTLERIGDEILTMGARYRTSDRTELSSNGLGGCRSLGGHALVCAEPYLYRLNRAVLPGSAAQLSLLVPNGGNSRVLGMVAGRSASTLLVHDDIYGKIRLTLVTDDMLRP